ncbi:MAG: alpha/beta hydrolase family protein [Betaproteobacteria bacterium]
MAAYGIAYSGRTIRLAGSGFAARVVGATVAALWLACTPAAAQEVSAGRELNEQVVRIPVRVTTESGTAEWSLVTSVFRPAGEGPFPVVILSHGSPGSAWERQAMGRYRPMPQIRQFIERGYAVIVPMRRGYGETGGEWAERYGTCIAPDYYRAATEGAKDLTGVVQFVRTLRYVKRDHVILVGQSAGGIASMAAASENPPGVVGVVNLAGGRGGRPYTHPGDPCVAANMTEAIGKLARTIKVPVLWHYSENDQFFAPRHVHAWFKAFEQAGAPGSLVMQPAFRWDGHGIFGADSGIPIWTAAFDRFVKNLRFPAPITPAVIPVVDQGAAPAAPAAASGT